MSLNSQSLPPGAYFLQHTVSPTGDQVFKYMSLGERLSFKPPQAPNNLPKCSIPDQSITWAVRTSKQEWSTGLQAIHGCHLTQRKQNGDTRDWVEGTGSHFRSEDGVALEMGGSYGAITV